MTSRLYSNFWPMGRPFPFVCACVASGKMGTITTKSPVRNFFIISLLLDVHQFLSVKGHSAGGVGRKPTARLRALDLKSGEHDLGGVGVDKMAFRQARVYCPKGRFWSSGRELFDGFERRMSQQDENAGWLPDLDRLSRLLLLGAMVT